MCQIENIFQTYKDIRLEILSYLPDIDKNMLLSANKSMYKIKYLITFDEQVNFNKYLYKLKYIDSFTNIVLNKANKYQTCLPKFLTHLIIGIKFKDNIDYSTIPSTVTHLEMYNKTSQQNIAKFIPRSVKVLFFDCGQQVLANTLPDSIIDLTICGNYPLQIGSIPKHVQKLNFDFDFNKKIFPGMIPDSVTDLDFGYEFNQPILHNCIPPNVVKLRLSMMFKEQILPGVLPKSIKKLDCGYSFKKILSGVIPPDVTKLRLGTHFNKPINRNILPASIQKLIFGLNFNQQILPGQLPPNLTYLEFSNGFNQKILPDVLPDTIKYLIFGYKYNQPIASDCYPKSLTRLTFDQYFDQEININVPTLTINNYRIKSNFIPQSVTKLFLGNNVTNLDIGAIPSSVKYLSIESKEINITDLQNNIPDTLEILKLRPDIVVTCSKNILVKFFDY